MVKRIDSVQLAKIKNSDLILVDVRELEEINSEAIPGGVNWPLSSFGGIRDQVSKKKPILFYCNSGLRSIVAAQLAEEWTSQEVYSLEGGLAEYIEQQAKAAEF